MLKKENNKNNLDDLDIDDTGILTKAEISEAAKDAKAERETVVNQNDLDKFGTVWTAQKPMMTKLDKLIDGENWWLIKEYFDKGILYAKEYGYKKGLVSFRAKKGSSSKVYTEEEKKTIVERFKLGRENAKLNKKEEDK